MPGWDDKTNKRYGKLVCIKYLGDSKWECLCDCGNKTNVSTSALTTGKTKSCGCLRYKYHINEKFFDIIDTEEKAYILGLFASDGNVSKSTTNIKLELKHDDVEILEKIKKAMGYDFNIIHCKYKSHFNDSDKMYDNHLVRLNITNAHIYKEIQKYGIVPNKSKNLDIDLSLIPCELFHHFLRGMWDGDGSIALHTKNRKTPQPNLSLTTSSIMFDKIYNVLKQEILDFVGYGYYRHKEKQYNKSLVVSQKNSIINLLNYLYKDATIYLERKYQRYLQVKEIYNTY